MSKSLLFLLFFLTWSCLQSLAQNKEATAVVKAGQTFQYEVKSKETVYSLCRRFQVTEAELLSLNPSLVNGLKSGQILIIPLKNAVTEPITTKAEQTADKKNLETEVSESNTNTTSQRNTYKSRITVLLPFNTMAESGTNDRFVEFYQGFLVAVDSLKNLGLSFEVEALESGYDDKLIRNYLNEGKLNRSDYCIGGVTPEQIAALSDWSRTSFRYAILPFSSQVQELEKNPYLYQTITPHEYINEKLSNYLCDNISGTHVLFFGNTDNTDDHRVKLLEKVKALLKSKGVTYTEVSDDETLENLAKNVVTGKVNRIIPAPTGLQETGSLLVRLDAFKNAHPESTFELIGFPDWIALNKNYTKYLFSLNALIYSNFYANYTHKNVQDFQLRFRQAFGSNLLNTYPRYGMMGYDIATWFIPKMVKERSISKNKALELDPLQHTFRFGTSGMLSGYANKSIYLIRYGSSNQQEVKLLP